MKKSFSSKPFIEKKPAGFCSSFISERWRPSTCAMRSLALGLRDSFHTVDELLPGSCLITPQCQRDSSTLPHGRDLSYHIQILTPFPCFVGCDIELSLFTCTVLFPSGHSQSNDTFLHWDLRLSPCHKLKQVWKPVLGPEVEMQLALPQRLVCISSAPHLVPLCHHYYSVGGFFFQLKTPEKCEGFLNCIFFSCGRGVVVSFAKPVVWCAGVWRCLWVQSPGRGWRMEQREPAWCNHSPAVCWEPALARGLSQTFLKQDLGKF